MDTVLNIWENNDIFLYFNLLESFYFNQRIIIYFYLIIFLYKRIRNFEEEFKKWKFWKNELEMSVAPMVFRIFFFEWYKMKVCYNINIIKVLILFVTYSKDMRVVELGLVGPVMRVLVLLFIIYCKQEKCRRKHYWCLCMTWQLGDVTRSL